MATSYDPNISLTQNLANNGFGHREGSSDGRREIFNIQTGEVAGLMNEVRATNWIKAGCNTFKCTSCPDLMQRLVSAQSVLGFIDIMTFAGFCDTRAELERHVVSNEEYAASVVAKNEAEQIAKLARRSFRKAA